MRLLAPPFSTSGSWQVASSTLAAVMDVHLLPLAAPDPGPMHLCSSGTLQPSLPLAQIACLETEEDIGKRGPQPAQDLLSFYG